MHNIAHDSERSDKEVTFILWHGRKATRILLPNSCVEQQAKENLGGETPVFETSG